MLQALILIALMVLLVLVLGLPLLLESDSPIPDYIGFFILALIVAAAIWSLGAWWMLLPILALVALVVRMERKARGAPADPAGLDRKGRSAGTRLRFRLGCAANLAVPLLIGALFVLPAGSAEIIVPSMVIALAASSLFRFSFYRSARRDEAAGFEAAVTASPAPLG